MPHSQFLGGDGRWTARDRDKALAYQAYKRSVCPQCGTRDDDWDHGRDDQEDRYAVTVQECTGCRVIADKQQELERQGGDLNGIKVGLLPLEVKAALDAEREALSARRRRHTDND